MAITDIFSKLINAPNTEYGTKKEANLLSGNAPKFNLLSPETSFNAYADIPINTNIDASQRQLSSVFSPTNTTSSNYAPVDARSLILTLNSPNATTKKQDTISGAITPTTVSPSVNQTPSMKGAEIPLSISPTLGLGGSGTNLIFWVVIGMIGFGAFKIITGKKKGGKK